jgi:hypothetical protein
MEPRFVVHIGHLGGKGEWELTVGAEGDFDIQGGKPHPSKRAVNEIRGALERGETAGRVLNRFEWSVIPRG